MLVLPEKVAVAATALPLYFPAIVPSLIKKKRTKNQKPENNKSIGLLHSLHYFYTTGSESMLQQRIQLSHREILWLIHEDVMQDFVNGTGGTVPCYFEIKLFAEGSPLTFCLCSPVAHWNTKKNSAEHSKCPSINSRRKIEGWTWS